MREIKFRAWDGKQMWHTSDLPNGYAISYDGKPVNFNAYGDYTGAYLHAEEESNVTLMQYTGLQDKNGKEIYEGDILKDDEGIAQVVFEDGQFMAHYQALSGKWNPYGALSKYMGDHDGEIIGNIHESPHLLDKAI